MREPDFSQVRYALSVRAPYAREIVTQEKIEEFRSWPLPVRYQDTPIALHESAGAILAIVTFDSCTWNGREYAWHVHWIQELSNPIPAKGRLRFWTLSEAVRRAIVRQL